MNKELLNAVKNMLIHFANENGIMLKDEFGTRDNFIKFVISFTIKSLMDICGLDLKTAYEMAMGEGSYQQMADDIWERLNAAAA